MGSRKKNRLDIMVWAYSGYADALGVFFGQVAKHLLRVPPRRPVRIRFLVWADQRQFVEEAIRPALDGDLDVEYEILQYREEWPFWRKIFTMRRIPLVKPVLILQDDFFFYEDVDLNHLLYLRELFHSGNRRYGFLRLVPSGIEHPNLRDIRIQGERFWEVDGRTRYVFSWQASFWRPWLFLLIHLIVRPQSIREENSPKYRWVMRRLRVRGICARVPEISYILTAIQRGRWDFNTPHGGEHLKEILETHGIDPNQRGTT